MHKFCLPFNYKPSAFSVTFLRKKVTQKPPGNYYRNFPSRICGMIKLLLYCELSNGTLIRLHVTAQ